MMLETLDKLDVPPRVKAKILCENAAALLNMA